MSTPRRLPRLGPKFRPNARHSQRGTIVLIDLLGNGRGATRSAPGYRRRVRQFQRIRQPGAGSATAVLRRVRIRDRLADPDRPAGRRPRDRRAPTRTRTDRVRAGRDPVRHPDRGGRPGAELHARHDPPVLPPVAGTSGRRDVRDRCPRNVAGPRILVLATGFGGDDPHTGIWSGWILGRNTSCLPALHQTILALMVVVAVPMLVALASHAPPYRGRGGNVGPDRCPRRACRVRDRDDPPTAQWRWAHPWARAPPAPWRRNVRSAEGQPRARHHVGGDPYPVVRGDRRLVAGRRARVAYQHRGDGDRRLLRPQPRTHAEPVPGRCHELSDRLLRVARPHLPAWWSLRSDQAQSLRYRRVGVFANFTPVRVGSATVYDISVPKN